jgi:4-amino-4-deoxy-L-arabinose transferase-like glycosyltransferase
LAIAWLVFGFGKIHFGPRAAFLGAIATMLTPAGFKLFGLARTDGVFAFTVTLTALLAFRAWMLGRGWTWVWLAAAASTLTKGPLGPVLGGLGLLASRWENRSGNPFPVRGSHLVGIALFLGLVGTWFLLAYWQLGEALTDKMLGKELLGHAVSAGKRHIPGALFYQPPLYYLGRAAPWSLLAYYGLWRIWRNPSPERATRRFERFLFCWFLGGLLIFCLAPHQRADLLWPLMPAAAGIAGRELDRLLERYPRAAVAGWCTIVVALFLIGLGANYFVVQARHPFVRQTMALKQMAATISAGGKREFPLSHVESPMTLQVYLNTLRPTISLDAAADLLRNPEAAFVVVNDAQALLALRKAGDAPWHDVLSSREYVHNKSATIIANRPTLVFATGAPFVLQSGPVFVRGRGVSLENVTGEIFGFKAVAPEAQVRLENRSSQSIKVQTSWRGQEMPVTAIRLLGPGEALVLSRF